MSGSWMRFILSIGQDLASIPTKNGAYTVAPGQYPVNVALANESGSTTSLSDLDGGFYLIAHAVVWGQYN